MNEEVIVRMENAMRQTMFSTYFFFNSVPYLFNIIFLSMLVIKIQFGVRLTWTTVFFPFFLADMWILVQKIADICSPRMPIWHPKKTKAVLHSLDCLGNLTTKLAIYLNFVGLWIATNRTVVICIPLWTFAILSTYFRCKFSKESEFSMLLGSAYHVVCRCFQPLLIALEFDKRLNQPWMVIMTPTWTILILCFSGALFLAYCAPIIRLHALEQLQTQATILLLLCCVYLLSLSCCGFLFVFWAAQRMDLVFHNATGLDVSMLQILLPLIVLQLILAIVQPAISAQSRRFQLLSQINNLQRETSDVPEGFLLTPVNMRQWLCVDTAGTSNNIFRKSQNCYIKLGYESHDALLESIIRLAEQERSLSVRESGTVQEKASLLTPPENRRQYQTFGISETKQQDLDLNHYYNREGLEPELPVDDSALDISQKIANPLNIPSELGICDSVEDDNRACVICFTVSSDTCFMPCGHGGLCFGCASKVASKQKHECPMCRTEINQVLRVNPKCFWLQGHIGIFLSEENYQVDSIRLDNSIV